MPDRHARDTFFATLASLALAGCVSHSHVEDLSGVAGLRGEPIEYQTTTSWALHGLFVFPLWGNAKKASTVEAFAREASERGATRMRITKTSGSTYWYVFPPLSFFIHPVEMTVEGDVEGTVVAGAGG